MRVEQKKQVILDLIEIVWRQGHVDRLAEFWTEDCINHAAEPGAQQGLPALRDYRAGFAGFLAAFSDVQIAVERQIAEGDEVVTQILTTAHHTGEFAGIPPTGRAVRLATIRIDRLRGERIAEHWSVADFAGMLDQLRAAN